MSELLIKTLAILILAAVSAVLLDGFNRVAAMTAVIAAVCITFVAVIKYVFPAIGVLNGLFETTGSESEYFAAALKSLGIAYISGFVADVCRDFGQNSIAAKAEFAGRCAVFLISVPMMTGIVQTALSIAKL
mgnify:FL=1